MRKTRLSGWAVGPSVGMMNRPWRVVVLRSCVRAPFNATVVSQRLFRSRWSEGRSNERTKTQGLYQSQLYRPPPSPPKTRKPMPALLLFYREATKRFQAKSVHLSLAI